jgi:uncharacterized membrane protein
MPLLFVPPLHCPTLQALVELASHSSSPSTTLSPQVAARAAVGEFSGAAASASKRASGVKTLRVMLFLSITTTPLSG